MGKSDLIEAIQKRANLFEAAATNAAMDVVRNPTNKEKMADAVKYLTKHDGRTIFAQEIVDLIHKYWPKDNQA